MHTDEESNLLQTGFNGSARLAGESVLARLGQEAVGKVQGQPELTQQLERQVTSNTRLLACSEPHRPSSCSQSQDL